MAKPKSLPYDAPETEGPYSVGLHSTAGGSDKVYNLTLEPVGDLWVVNFANGKRGGTLATGTKTATPLTYAEARKELNSKLYEQVGKGYVPISGSRFGDGMTADAIATIAKESSGQIPQLLNHVPEGGLEGYLDDDDFVAEIKHDGERRFAIVNDGKAIGGNRTGQTVALPGVTARAIEALGRDMVLDGEQVGDVFWCFDIVSMGPQDLRHLTWEARKAMLEQILASADGKYLRAVESVYGREAKQALLEHARETRGEGIVFKNRDEPYQVGKPAKGGSWMKFKFWKELSAIVGGVNNKRSVALELVDDADGSRIQVGNVTIPANKEIPAVGDVIEVSYLYAFEGGSLFQPGFEKLRNDITHAECLASQRIFVAGPQLDEDVSAGPRM